MNKYEGGKESKDVKECEFKTARMPIDEEKKEIRGENGTSTCIQCIVQK